ncbi:alpha-D-glucose phosphate-specific phosphoglucomutase [Megasphaera vaginalis (ex Srinivasan et al. 2021)]|uniref:Putative phosphoglucomutase, alpha-D-glucose phosphate-specific n=1 Tax=Megasphaera vaginalis (ex Srinivasan et al. 2021) TaxID=1111454 RepID=U7URF1_9FIRM|nr:alpha-D-glucose phosphate-specific phosphoglucomutase [Megasphaera vaginalis (ex Srinivasan et al. 2021)]ERT61905.1 putative phosphoglucomutase, alpha-D-glucose phosphate-specific [Megasphaera vaginalis (ex Srinivasan et al. 2021)]
MGKVTEMAIHALAGTRIRKEDYIDLQQLATAYATIQPDVTQPAQRVCFGTSGHRGQAGNGSFTAAHVAAVTQAVCTLRRSFGASGPLFVGADTHFLSKLAYHTVLSVLTANGVEAFVDSDDDFVPTPSVSRAILRYNRERTQGLADGLIITPSHNPPEHGGIKYNPISGGPAETAITQAIEAEANRLLAGGNREVRSVAAGAACGTPYDFKGLYVGELETMLDMDAIRRGNSRILVNALGGSGMNYWHKISEQYGIPIDFVNDSYDPQFTFMNYDHDGKVRMDCSSSYVMSAVATAATAYDLILANDPDYDRFGVVSGRDGMISANAYLTVAAHYLLTHRQFSGKGIAKTVVTTDLLSRVAEQLAVPVYEVPVGFKYFGSLFSAGKIAFAGEESAGASFVAKDGAVWTTDKDGIVMCLLAAEIKAVTGKSPLPYYTDLCASLGRPVAVRSDAPASLEEKDKISRLTAADVSETSLCGSPILSVLSKSPYGDYAVGGVKISLANGWIAARPSGTEDMYKLYAESFVSEEHANELLEEGKNLIAKALAK